MMIIVISASNLRICTNRNVILFLLYSYIIIFLLYLYICMNKYFSRCQLELEGKIVDLTTELSVKDDTIKKYVSKLQCFCEKLKEHAKQANQVISHPLTLASDQDCNVSASFIIIIQVEIYFNKF